MFARKAVFSSIGRATVMATVAAMAIAVVGPSPASAGSASGATDFSSRARVHHHGGGGGAAAAAAFAGIIGTGLAIAATQNRRAYYDDYDGGPAYYGGGPVYYGNPGYGYYGGGPAYFNGTRDYYHDYRYR